MRICYFYIIIILLFSNQFSQAGDFRYLRTDEGLYNGEITSVSQDKSGKMWFGSWSGLTSYNGFGFQFFKPELGLRYSLPDKKINQIFVDSNDNLWVASLTGISVYNKKYQTFLPVRLEGVSPVNFYVYGFYETKGKTVVHTNYGLFVIYQKQGKEFRFSTKKLKIFDGTVEFLNYVHYVNTFDDRLVMVSNSDQNNPTRIYTSELIADQKDTLIRILYKIPYRLQVNTVGYSKNENKLYLGTSNGISVLSLERLTVSDAVFFHGKSIQTLLCTSDNRIYCSGSEPALYYADLKTHETGQYLPDPLRPGTLLDNNITCLFEDFSGSLWIGHQGMGLSILNLNRKAFLSFKRDPSSSKSLNGNIVMCFNGTKNEVFIGLRQGGLNFTSKTVPKNGVSEFRVLSYRQQPKADSDFDHIWDIARETDSVFWIASDGGLAKLKKTNAGWIYGTPDEKPLFEGVVRKILIDKDRNIWCGTFNEGLRFFPALRNNPERKSYPFAFDNSNPEGISDRTVLSMLIDSKKHFWIGTNNGLNLVKSSYDQLDLSGKEKPDIRFKKFIATKPDKDFLNANEINCIYENSDGKIWLATQGGGINFLEPDSLKFSHLTTENGLPGNDVLGILSDRMGIKWISTNKGIVSYDYANKTKPFTYYSNTDGLQGETFKVNSYYQSSDGEMFFGGDNGFSRFYPDQIKFNPVPPRIGLTFLRIANKVVNIGDTISKGNLMNMSLNEMDHIELPYQKNSFSIGVGVHHYQYPEGNLIRYKLEGFIDRWITMSAINQNVYFSKLPYGKYTLRISAVSTDNVEAESERLLKIIILPPWYQTWLFRIIVFVLLSALIVFIIFWLIRQQQHSFQKKIDAISFESNENKMRFLTNIAHELRTPLSLVIGPIEDMKMNYTNIDPSWKNHLNLIYRNSNYLLNLINQIIDFRKLNAGKLQLNLQKTDIVSLVTAVVTNFKGLESRRKTKLNFKVPDTAIFVDIDGQKIEEVLYNLLSNAFKHTQENHSIEVSLQVVPKVDGPTGAEMEQVRITIFNEGKDISDEDKVRIFEQFYKVSKKVEGAGIGLSFSKSLIEMHHGTVTVESVNGIGVAFHVNLPFNQMEFVGPDDQKVPGLAWQEDDFDSDRTVKLEKNSKKLSLVIIEDNIDLRTFLRTTLCETYICHEAGDGNEGYDLVTSLIPDIVISDIVMPGIDGYELCEKIKENRKTCHIPVILLTAKSASEHIVSGYQKGADAYVIKPFEVSIIKAQISRLIKNRELIREKYLTQNFMVEVSTSNLSKDDELIVKLRQLLEQNLSEADFNVRKLSSDLNISTTHLYRKLKALTGLSPVEFIRMFKLQKACEMLSNTTNSIKEIGYGLGFNNLSYFVKCFREQFGVTPSAFRQKGLPDQTTKNSTNQSDVS